MEPGIDLQLITGDITGFTFEKSSVGGALTNVVKLAVEQASEDGEPLTMAGAKLGTLADLFNKKK